MTLAEYLKRSKKKAATLAKELGVSHVAVWRWVEGECAPRAEAMLAIERITGGTVTVADLLRTKKKAQRAKSQRRRAA